MSDSPTPEIKSIVTAPLILRAFEGQFPDIPLTPRIKRIIEDIHRMDMGSLNHVTDTIAVIVQDGVLNEDDIPQLIQLANQLFTLIASTKSSMKRKRRTEQIKVCAELMKYLLRLYIQEGNMGIPEDEKPVFLARVEVLVDACIQLMQAIALSPMLRKWIPTCKCIL